MEKYSAEKCLKVLREIFLPDHLTSTCVNVAYSDFEYEFVGGINLIALAKRIRVKANSNLGLITKLCQQYKDGINSIKRSRVSLLKLIAITLKSLKCTF